VKRCICSRLFSAVVRRHPAVARAFRYSLIPLALLSTLNAQLSTCSAQGTAFLYQGRLNDGGNPAGGIYDLRFTIYDSTNIPGNVIAGPLTNSATAVSNGLFTVTLDFGPGVFTGLDRWLDIGVRTNGSLNAYTVLVPRQHLTPVPYAIFATTASNLSGSLPASQLSGTLPASAFVGYTGTVVLTNGANLFGGAFSGTFNGLFGGAFAGNGAAVTNVNVTNLTGVLANSQLPANAALVNSNQVFSGTNLFTGFNVFNGPTNSFNGAFSGNGINLTNLNGSQIATGTVADARLTTNVALLNRNQTFTGNNVFNGANTFTNLGNSFIGSFFGNGLVGWIVVSGTSTQAMSDAGYLLVSTQLTTVTLPASPNVEDIVRISGAGAGGWQVAQNSGQAILGNFSGFTNASWTVTGAAALNWYDIASSADGTKMAAVVSGGGVYTSTDSGATWGQINSTARAWRGIASSSDGSKLAAVVNSSFIFTSTNAGSTWVQQTTGLPGGGAAWSAIASSADGAKLVAVVNGGGIYTSANSGSSWTQQTSGLPGSGVAAWTSVASSSDGTKLAAVGGSGIYISSNSGGSWSSSSSGSSWSSVASSADGTKLVAAQNTGSIYTWTSSSGSWTQRTTGLPAGAAWTSVTSSSDGGKLAATVSGGGIYTSLNWGASWAQQSGEPNATWSAITSSADGSKLAAVINSATSGGIYTMQASVQTTTTTGTSGGITGGQGAAVELQYIGNGQFMPVSSAGIIWAF